jgi:GTP-binding protein HflX
MDLANRVLADIGVVDKPIRLIFNKIDRVPDNEGLGRLARVYPGALFTSATMGKGLDEVRRAITAFVESREEVLDVAVPCRDGRTISAIYEMGEVLSVQEEDERLKMKVRVSRADASRLRGKGVVV